MDWTLPFYPYFLDFIINVITKNTRSIIFISQCLNTKNLTIQFILFSWMFDSKCSLSCLLQPAIKHFQEYVPSSWAGANIKKKKKKKFPGMTVISKNKKVLIILFTTYVWKSRLKKMLDLLKYYSVIFRKKLINKSEPSDEVSLEKN